MTWEGEERDLPSGQSMKISSGTFDGRQRWLLELFHAQHQQLRQRLGRPRGVYASDLQVFGDGIAKNPEESAISLPVGDREEARAYINTIPNSR
jgi:hypothetical protein